MASLLPQEDEIEYVKCCMYNGESALHNSYHIIVGLVSEILICMNYASCRGLANINSAVSHSCIFISSHCMCHSSVLVISLSYVPTCSNTLKEWKFLLCCLTQKAKGLQKLCASRAHHLHTVTLLFNGKICWLLDCVEFSLIYKQLVCAKHHEK